MRLRRYILALVVIAGLLTVLRLTIPEAVFFPRDPPTFLSDEKRAEWSKEFRTVGLASVPRHARWHADMPFDGEHGHLLFSADERAVQEWLANSGSIRTARVRTRPDQPDRQAYLICMHPVNRGCIVTVRHLAEERARVGVIIMSIPGKEAGAESGPHSCEEVYRQLEVTLEGIGA